MSFPTLYIEEITQEGTIDWRIFVRYIGSDTYAIYGTRRDAESKSSKHPFFRYNMYGRASVAKHIKTLIEENTCVNYSINMIDRDEVQEINFQNLYNYIMKSPIHSELIGYDERPIEDVNIKKMLITLRDMF